MSEPAVLFDEVNKQFSTGDFGVKNLSFKIFPGEIVAIVGQTGCGKSTAFNLLVGLTQATSGRVLIEGVDPFQAFDDFKGKLGIVFQNDRLLPWRTAIENAAIGLEVNGIPLKDRTEIAKNWLERLGLSGREGKFPHELSGGMKQRVAISRAFSINPNIILCDEAFSALDEITAAKLRQEFVDLVQENNKTGLFITHSISEALDIANRILVFKKPGHVANEIIVPKQKSIEKVEELKKDILQSMDIA